MSPSASDRAHSPAQQSLPLPVADDLLAIWTAARVELKQAIEDLGIGEVAKACDTTENTIRDALREIESKYARLEWLFGALLLAAGRDTDDHRRARARLLLVLERALAIVGFTAVPIVELTAEQLAERAIDELRQFGPQGQAAIDRVYGRGLTAKPRR